MLRSKNRLYTKEEPSRDARFIIVYCEGQKREYQYFEYFCKMTSKLRLEIVPPEESFNDTSPTGLLARATLQLIQAEENSKPEYDLFDIDEIWFVIDTDTWGNKILTLKNYCKNKTNWFVAQSNPCFEIWLFYHFFTFEPFDEMEKASKWKDFLNTKTGGFNSKKHPVYVKTAIKNAKNKFREENECVNIGCTEVFKLAESFYPLVSAKIEEALLSMEQNVQ
jgi:hypothetical protein